MQKRLAIGQEVKILDQKNRKTPASLRVKLLLQTFKVYPSTSTQLLCASESLVSTHSALVYYHYILPLIR